MSETRDENASTVRLRELADAFDRCQQVRGADVRHEVQRQLVIGMRREVDRLTGTVWREIIRDGRRWRGNEDQ
jgi:hypothetical protein